MKHIIIGTQYEWESHIDNIFRIFNKNLKTYSPKNMLDVGCGKGFAGGDCKRNAGSRADLNREN